jgi:hypothetical protein
LLLPEGRQKYLLKIYQSKNKSRGQGADYLPLVQETIADHLIERNNSLHLNGLYLNTIDLIFFV